MAKSRVQKKDKILITDLVNQNLDWDFFISKADSQFLIPLIQKNLFDFREKIPPTVWKKMEKNARKAASNNLLNFSYAKEIIQSLNRKKIEAVFLKGQSVSKTFSQDTLKVSRDIDLLVKKEEIDFIEKILFENEWSTFQNYQEVKKERLKTDYELPPIFKKNVMLDLHFKPMDFPELNSGELFETAEVFDLEGVKAKKLSVENQLIYLCLHSALNHGFEFIVRDLVDLNETITFHNKKINWSLLLKKSKELGSNAIVFHCLFLTNQLLGTKIPFKALRELKKDSSKIELFFLKSVNQENVFDLKTKNQLLQKFFLSFLFQKSVIKKAKFIYYAFFPTLAHLTKIQKNIDFEKIFVYRLQNPLRLVLKVFKKK